MQTESPVAYDPTPNPWWTFYTQRIVWPSFLFVQAALVISLLVLTRTLRGRITNEKLRQTARWLCIGILLPLGIGIILGISHYLLEIRVSTLPTFSRHLLAAYEGIARCQLGFWVSLALYVGVTMILVRRAFREESLTP